VERLLTKNTTAAGGTGKSVVDNIAAKAAEVGSTENMHRAIQAGSESQEDS
jgi:hypothetical protein